MGHIDNNLKVLDRFSYSYVNTYLEPNSSQYVKKKKLITYYYMDRRVLVKNYTTRKTQGEEGHLHATVEYYPA